MNKRGMEAKENWLAARIDELLVDAELVESHEYCGPVSLTDYAKQQAAREHASLIADLGEAIIDSMELKL